jgi:circadian clock protein KaiC
VAGLDNLIEGGFPSGSLNLVVGYSGTGTSTLARHFLHSRLAEGEKCLCLSFHETVEEFIRNGQALGMDCASYIEDASLEFWSLSPLRLIPESFLFELSQRIRHGNYGNMVWDAISNLRVSIQDESVLRETQHLIALLLRRAGITTVLINESTEMCGLIRLTDLDFAELADSAIQLSFAEVDGRVHRFLGIMKMARTNHTKDLHEFEITSRGMRVLKKATGVSGILSGRAEGKLEAVADHVLGPLLESSSALGDIIDIADLSEETRRALIAAREKLGIADILLREHFGMTDFASVVEEIKDR